MLPGAAAPPALRRGLARADPRMASAKAAGDDVAAPAPVSAILERMHGLRHGFLLLAICCLWPGAAWAEREALPPPTEVRDTPEARETIVPADEFDLQQELKAPKTEDQVEVRVHRRKDGAVVQEYSVRGRVYLVRVQPPGGMPAYYLYDSDGDGTFERRLPGGYKPPSPPLWIIKRF